MAKKKKGGKKKSAKSSSSTTSSEPKISQVERFIKFSVATRSEQINRWREDRDRNRQENLRLKQQLEQLKSTQEDTVQQLRQSTNGNNTKLLDVEKELLEKVEDATVGKEEFVDSEEETVQDLRNRLAELEEKIYDRNHFLQELQIFQVVGQQENEREIARLEKTKEDMIAIHIETLKDISQRFGFARKRFEANLDARVERTRELAAENALHNQSSRDKMAAAEREWLKREVEVHHTETERLTLVCEELEKENLKILGELTAKGAIQKTSTLLSLQQYAQEQDNSHHHHRRNRSDASDEVEEDEDIEDEEECENDLGEEGNNDDPLKDTVKSGVSFTTSVTAEDGGPRHPSKVLPENYTPQADGRWIISKRGQPAFEYHRMTEAEMVEKDNARRAQNLHTFSSMSLQPKREKVRLYASTEQTGSAEVPSPRIKSILEHTRKIRLKNTQNLAALRVTMKKNTSGSNLSMGSTNNFNNTLSTNITSLSTSSPRRVNKSKSMNPNRGPHLPKLTQSTTTSNSKQLNITL
eukprot:m.12154 g.12154  ORF g.12154 m.12154 type:complete len:526 (+) comp3959_c0_seq2:227-1804(+)